MIKVRATGASKALNKALKELHRIAEVDEEFEVTESRFEYLHGNNRFKAIFVEPVNAKLTTTPAPEKPKKKRAARKKKA